MWIVSQFKSDDYDLVITKSFPPSVQHLMIVEAYTNIA